jgi:hypothetical protein
LGRTSDRIDRPSSIPAVLGHHHFADDALKEATQYLLASSDDTRCTGDLTVALADALTKVKQIFVKTP